MSRRTPARPLLASVAMALTLVACGEGDPSTVERPPGSTTAPPASATGAPSPSPTAPATAASSFAGTLVTVRVANGKVETASREVRVKLGTRVRIEVTADVTDEVHVHTYDEHAGTKPGVPAAVEFVADIPGIVEVELHGTHLLLVKLRVS